MPRTLSSALTTLLTKANITIRHLLVFTGSVTTYRFCEENLVVAGNTYEARLELREAVEYQEQLTVFPLEVKLSNISLETATLLKNEQPGLLAKQATLSRFFLEADEAVTLLVARIGTLEVDEQDATISLVNELDPASTVIPVRRYGPRCMWRFKDTKCGYVDGVDPDDPATSDPFLTCPKDFASCVARGREFRFPGFIYITRTMATAVESSNPTRYTKPRLPAATA